VYYKGKPSYYYHDIYDPYSNNLNNKAFIRIIGDAMLYYSEENCYLMNY